MAVSVNDKLVTVSGLKAGCDSKLNTKMNNASGQLPIANGGTNASTAAAARTNLDVYSKSETNNAIAQSTVVETISQSDYITLADGIKMERWDGAKKSGKIIQVSFLISKSDETSFGSYTSIGSINNPYRPLVRFTNPVSLASSPSAAVLINGNFAVTIGGGIAIYATGSNSKAVYVSMTYMIN